MTTQWNYREHLGPRDSLAPHQGGYWIADVADLDLIARVWHDDEADTWRWDVTEADEVAYNGTPSNFGTANKRVDAQAEVENYLDHVKS